LTELGSPNAVFRVDLDALIDRLSSTGGQLTEVLNACDGMRSVVQIVDQCSIGAIDVLRSLLQLRDDGLISDPGRPARTDPPDQRRPDALESTLMGGGAGVTHRLPVSPPLAQATGPAAPRRDSPAAGSRLTAPLGQAGLPVSEPASKKLPAVTMQFPAGIAATERSAPPQAPGMPPARVAPVTLAQGASEKPSSLTSETPPARTTMPRPLPPRLQARASTTLMEPMPGPVSPSVADRPAERAAPIEPPAAEVVPNSTAMVVATPASQPASVVIRPQPIVRIATPGDVPTESSPAPSPAMSSLEQRRPWWDRRNDRRPPAGPAASETQWDPVWPRAALPPSESSNAPKRTDREAAGGESPTVYLPAHVPDARPAPGRAAPPRAAVARAGAIRRGAPYAEGIRPRSDHHSRGRNSRQHLPWWQRHRSTLLAISAVVLLASLVAIGVVLVRSIGS
jgi:hypothetical protein